MNLPKYMMQLQHYKHDTYVSASNGKLDSAGINLLETAQQSHK